MRKYLETAGAVALTIGYVIATLAMAAGWLMDLAWRHSSSRKRSHRDGTGAAGS